MKTFIAALSLLILAATTATAQRLVYVAPAPQAAPSTPTVVVPLPSMDGLVLVPSAPQQPQTGVVTDSENRRFYYQETGPQSGAFWIYPQQSD